MIKCKLLNSTRTIASALKVFIVKNRRFWRFLERPSPKGAEIAQNRILMVYCGAPDFGAFMLRMALISIDFLLQFFSLSLSLFELFSAALMFYRVGERGKKERLPKVIKKKTVA